MSVIHSNIHKKHTYTYIYIYICVSMTYTVFIPILAMHIQPWLYY